MPVVEVTEFHALNPTATLGTVTPTVNPGNTSGTFTVHSFPTQLPDPNNPQVMRPVFAHLMTAFRYGATAGQIRIKSPDMHDFQSGITLANGVSMPTQLLPVGEGSDQQFKPLTVLTLDISGGAAETDLGAFTIYYEGIPGATFIDTQTLRQKARPQMVGLPCSITGTGVGFTGVQALNATTKTLKATSFYALLGATVDIATIAGIRINGPDTGNYGNFIPLNPSIADLTSKWFLNLSDLTGVPQIPVISGANAPGTNIDVLAVAAATPIVTLIFQELNY